MALYLHNVHLLHQYIDANRVPLHTASILLPFPTFLQRSFCYLYNTLRKLPAYLYKSDSYLINARNTAILIIPVLYQDSLDGKERRSHFPHVRYTSDRETLHVTKNHTDEDPPSLL